MKDTDKETIIFPQGVEGSDRGMLRVLKKHHNLGRGKWRLFFKNIIYLFIRDRERERQRDRAERERGRDTGRRRSSSWRSPLWDLIPRLRDHTLSQRQTLNCWATQASQGEGFSKEMTLFLLLTMFSDQQCQTAYLCTTRRPTTQSIYYFFFGDPYWSIYRWNDMASGVCF